MSNIPHDVEQREPDVPKSIDNNGLPAEAAPTVGGEAQGELTPVACTCLEGTVSGSATTTASGDSLIDRSGLGEDFKGKEALDTDDSQGITEEEEVKLALRKTILETRAWMAQRQREAIASLATNPEV